MFDRVKDVGHPNEEMLSVYREYGVIKKSSRDDNTNQAAEDRNIYQLVDNMWFVVNRMKAWQGSVGIAPTRGIVSGHYLCFRPRHREDSRFLNWLLRSNVYATEYLRMSRGVRPGQIEIDNDELRGLRIALPPIDEQRRIADFLDDEIGKLRALGSLHARMLTLGEARVDSKIRSLIEDSGLVVASGGSRIAPIRRILCKLDRPTIPTPEVVTAFRDGQVTARSTRRVDGFTESASSEPQGQGVIVGDVVVHGLDGFAGAIGDAEASGNCSAVYHVCRPIDQGDPAFWGRVLRILAVDGYLSLYGSSARERAVDFRNWDRFGSVPILRASFATQRAIGDTIRGLRPLRARVSQMNDLLAERRQALITAAVTGQIDVSTARGVAV
ncbi:MAG: restriction endonuclease subunit S [Actinomycetia bacterium]|nr:restriction endonuclease subunit S [Actinomycetes bacterium]